MSAPDLAGQCAVASRMTSVAIYTRLSQSDGEQTATARQERACRRSLRLGWLVTACSRMWTRALTGATADPFDLLNSTVAASQIDGVLVWKLDRLVRRPPEFVAFWTLSERRKVFVASNTESTDTSTE